MKYAILVLPLLAAAGSAAWSQPEFPPPPPARLYRPARRPIADFNRAAERAIAQAIDEERQKFAPGAPSLAPDPDLTEIAESRSQSMADGAPFAHEDREGHFIAADLVRTRFGPYGFIGENIMEMGSTQAFSAAAFAKAAVEGWMKSPGHRENILDGDYSQSGIGVAIRGGRAYATQVFFGPSKHTQRSPL
jgi:uncharacterized protein YkwD